MKRSFRLWPLVVALTFSLLSGCDSNAPGDLRLATPIPAGGAPDASLLTCPTPSIGISSWMYGSYSMVRINWSVFGSNDGSTFTVERKVNFGSWVWMGTYPFAGTHDDIDYAHTPSQNTANVQWRVRRTCPDDSQSGWSETAERADYYLVPF